MTDPQAALLTQIENEHEALQKDGVVRFDGSVAWSSLTKLLAEEAMGMAERLKQSGVEIAGDLPDHFGTPAEPA